MLNPLNLISKIFKSSNQKELDKLAKFVKNINQLEEKTSKIENDIFPKELKIFKIKNYGISKIIFGLIS